MPSRSAAEPARVAPRLTLTIPQACDPARMQPSLVAALNAADVAAVLLDLPRESERDLIRRVRAIAPAIQERGAALILAGNAEIVARAGADGTHAAGVDAFATSAAALKPDRIVGCGALATRHDAMVVAEAGADYVMFGEPDGSGSRPPFDAIVERVAWWAELFEVPCVAFAAGAAEVPPLAAAGADFVALGPWVWSDERKSAVLVQQAAGALHSGSAT